VEAHRRRCRARSAEHFLGHIDADNLACGADLSRGDEAVETTPRPEIDNTLAGLQSAERERVADAGKRLDRAVRHSGDDRVVIAQAVRQRASGMKWKLPCGLTATARYLVLTSARSAIASTGKPSLIPLLLRENCPIVVRGNSTVRFSKRPAGSTVTATSRASIRISVLGPRGCSRTTVSSRGRRCQLTTPNCPLGFRIAATVLPNGKQPGCQSSHGHRRWWHPRTGEGMPSTQLLHFLMMRSSCAIWVLAVACVALSGANAASPDAEEMVQDAFAAAPPSIASTASVMDWDNRVLRQGGGTYVCFPNIRLFPHTAGCSTKGARAHVPGERVVSLARRLDDRQTFQGGSSGYRLHVSRRYGGKCNRSLCLDGDSRKRMGGRRS